MPSRNQRKDYLPNSYYHLYNRGVNKMEIFHDKQDYQVFLYYIKTILSPIETLEAELNTLMENPHINNQQKKKQILRLNRALHHSYQTQLFNHIDLLNYCIMPNHFHLLVFQRGERSIELLMQRLATGYSGYYNSKHDRVGPLFQGRTHASHLYFEPKLQALVAARYIERNPWHGNVSRASREYPYSSLKYYQPAHKNNVPFWLKTNHLEALFGQIKKQPNGVLEKTVANYQTLPNFIEAEIDISLEDVRLDHLLRI